ncbi:MAG: hypothetical protein WC901_03040 [Candidatus Margulisiibacteriota bacterium]
MNGTYVTSAATVTSGKLSMRAAAENMAETFYDTLAEIVTAMQSDDESSSLTLNGKVYTHDDYDQYYFSLALSNFSSTWESALSSNLGILTKIYDMNEKAGYSG